MTNATWTLATLLCAASAAGATLAPFDRVVAALAAGQVAEATHRGPALARAGRILMLESAMPAEDTEDLAQRWQPNGLAAASPPLRNRALGPAYRHIALKAGAAAHFEQVYLAGQRARAAVVPFNDTAFTFTITDDEGHVICPPGRTPEACEWLPIATTRYRIDLVDRSRQGASYYLVLQ